MSNEIAWVIVDLVNDFVTGKFGSDHAKAVASKTQDTIKKLGGKITIIFTQDTHIPDDPEFKVWGEHCLMGTEGCELVDELKDVEGFKVRKRHFDSFYDSDLDGLLSAKSVKKIYISGISTDICVLHTASGAFHRYYEATIVEDLCASIDPRNHELAIKNMQKNYGFKVIGSEKFIEEVESYGRTT